MLFDVYRNWTGTVLEGRIIPGVLQPPDANLRDHSANGNGAASGKAGNAAHIYPEMTLSRRAYLL